MVAAALKVAPHKEAQPGECQHDGAKDEAHDARYELNVAQSIFCTADRALNLALGLIQHAFGLKFRVTGYFTGSFFHCAFGLIGRAVDAFIIHF